MCLDVMSEHRGVLGSAARHAVQSGGKGLRIRTTLLAGAIGGERLDSGRLRGAAASVELVHLASLVHDDVMDAGSVRRGQPTVNALWGDRIAVLTGDLILAKAAQLAADVGPRLCAMQAAGLGELVRGQAAELGAPGGIVSIKQHLDTIRRKTAMLFMLAVDTGSCVADSDDLISRHLRVWADNFGIAFQLADDLRDLMDTDHLKTGNCDLLNEVPTYPVLHALRADHPSAEELARLLEHAATLNTQEIRQVRTLIESLGGTGAARQAIEDHCAAASTALLKLPAQWARDELLAMRDGLDVGVRQMARASIAGTATI